MTRQPAIDIGILLIMAFQAHSHTPLFVRQPLNVLNLTVAFLAGDFAVDVSLMIEQDMLGHIVDFFPGSGCSVVEILMFLLNPGMFFDDIVMAVQTLFHRWNARMVGVGNIGMTVLALDLLDAAMHRVAERYRLFRSESEPRPGPKYINKACGCQYGDQGQKNNYRILSQRFIPCQKAT